MKKIIILFSALTIFASLALPNIIFSADKFTKSDWIEMDRNIQQLKNNFKTLKKKVDINTARKIILKKLSEELNENWYKSLPQKCRW